MSFSQAQSRGRLLRFLVDNLGQEIDSGTPAANGYIAINSNSELVLAGAEDTTGPFIEINGSAIYTTSSVNIGSTATPGHELVVTGAVHVSKNSAGDDAQLVLHEDQNSGGRLSFTNTADTNGPYGNSWDWTIYGDPAAQGSQDEASLRFWYADADGDGSGQDILYIQGDQKVGIMDTSPSYTLDVGGTFRAQGNAYLGDAAADVTSVTSQLTASEGAYFADRVGIGDATPSYELDVNGTINIADNSYLRIGEIAVVHYTSNQTSIGSAASSQTLALNCGNSSHAPSNTDPAMFIDATGSVGIGAATTPNSVLHIRSEHNPMIKIDPGTSTTADPALWLQDTSAGAGFKLWYDNNVGSTYLDNYYDHANGDIFIRTKVAGTPVNAVTIDAAGSVTTAGALYVGTAAQLYTNTTHTMLTNGNGGYIDLKSNHATYGVIIRDYNSSAWANINTNNAKLQIAYNHASLTQGLFMTEPSTDVSRIGINDSTPSYAFDCNGDAQFTGNVRLSGIPAGTANNISIGASSNKLYENTSTRKAKTNISYNNLPGLNALLSLKVASFDFLNGDHCDMIGLIAEDVGAVDERLVYMGPDYSRDEFGSRVQKLKEDESGPIGGEYILDSEEIVPLSVNETAIMGVLIKSIQELKNQNDALLHRIEQLENA